MAPARGRYEVCMDRRPPYLAPFVRRAAVACAALPLLVPGCAGDGSRPAPAEDCVGAGCVATGIGDRPSGAIARGGRGGQGGGGSFAGAGGGSLGGAGGGTGGLPPVPLQGIVSAVADLELAASTAPPSGAIQVLAPTPGQGVTQGPMGATGSYFLQDADGRRPIWVGAGPFGNGNTRYLDTLQRVDGATARLRCVPRTLLDDIVALYAVSTVQFDPESGHAIITLLVRSSQAPLERFRVLGTTAAIAYDVGSEYSDAQTESGPRGTAVLLNLPGDEFPGQDNAIRIDLGANEETFHVPVVPGGLTLATFEVSP